ncbi:MAG: CdaR family protein [Verrucomicrobiota bacterium]
MKDRISRFRENMKKEKWLLLLCFLLAFLSWQGIRRNIGFEVSVSNIAVEVDLPKGWAVWEKSTPHVNILFRGSREDIRYLNNEQLRVVVPLSDPIAGDEIHIRLLEKYLKNPTGAKIVRFSPPDIFVKLDKESERLISVKAAINGSLPDGLEVDRIVCTPASVRVSGAEQVLSEMQNIHTEPINLSDRQSSFKESVPIALPLASRIGVDPDWVSVDFMIEQHTSTQEFEDIPVRALCASGEARHIELQPTTIKITVKGQQQRLEQMRTVDIFAYVNCADLTESTGYDMPVIIKLPSGVQLVKTDPATIHIDIENMK